MCEVTSGLHWSASTKGGGDFATTADIEAEAVMLELLRRHCPNDRLVGEESGRSDAGDDSRLSLIDPLCGP